ncbi:MAG: CDP-alcohol phosphatidyltransferase family protein [Solitalea-like symbiont of Acarus siro]
MKIKRHIPNGTTLCNALAGCLGIVTALKGDLILSSYLIAAAALFDFFDGLSARVLNVYSPIGKDLDSLADVISFGICPAAILFKTMENYFDLYGLNFLFFSILPYSAFIISMASALRLAKFNKDERQSVKFIGLPTPANALLIASIPHILLYKYVQSIMNNTALVTTMFIVLILISSYLLVSKISFIDFKTNNVLNKPYLKTIYTIIIGISLLLIFIFKFLAVPIILMIYIIFSLVVFNNKK